MDVDQDQDQQSVSSETSSTKSNNEEKELLNIRKKVQEKISKRLTYLLRYGAQKEGLFVYDGGYVKLKDLLDTSLLKQNIYYYNYTINKDANVSQADKTKVINADINLVMDEIKQSTSHRKVNRFETKEVNNEIYVRATYGRKFERSPYHNGTKVHRLLETCLSYIVKNIHIYGFENFPDEFLIK